MLLLDGCLFFPADSICCQAATDVSQTDAFFSQAVSSQLALSVARPFCRITFLLYSFSHPLKEEMMFVEGGSAVATSLQINKLTYIAHTFYGMDGTLSI